MRLQAVLLVMLVAEGMEEEAVMMRGLRLLLIIKARLELLELVATEAGRVEQLTQWDQDFVHNVIVPLLEEVALVLQTMGKQVKLLPYVQPQYQMVKILISLL
jgi:hypothetical protein